MKTTYANLKLNIKNEVNKIEINELSVEIQQYLSINKKHEIILKTLLMSEEKGFYNPIKLDMYLHTLLVMEYSNISFTEKQKEDFGRIYDNLKSNGILDMVINEIPEDEYNYIFNNLLEMKKDITKYGRTVVSIIDGLIDDFLGDEVFTMLKDSLKNIDPKVVQLALSENKILNGRK